MSFGEQRQGNDLVYRFKLNSSVSSLEAIRVEQLGAIDGVLLKENSFIGEKKRYIARKRLLPRDFVNYRK